MSASNNLFIDVEVENYPSELVFKAIKEVILPRAASINASVIIEESAVFDNEYSVSYITDEGEYPCSHIDQDGVVAHSQWAY